MFPVTVDLREKKEESDGGRGGGGGGGYCNMLIGADYNPTVDMREREVNSTQNDSYVGYLELQDMLSYHHGFYGKGIHRLVGDVCKVAHGECGLGHLYSSPHDLLDCKICS